MSQEYFIGIDLGTTNSLMAWSRVDSNEKLRTEIVDISMIDESGGKIKNDR
jgi:molecular chaperone DnaK (HSP70)